MSLSLSLSSPSRASSLVLSPLLSLVLLPLFSSWPSSRASPLALSPSLSHALLPSIEGGEASDSYQAISLPAPPVTWPSQALESP